MAIVDLNIDAASADDVAQRVREVSQSDIPDTSIVTQDPSQLHTLRLFFCHIRNNTRFIMEPGDSYLLPGTRYFVKPLKMVAFRYSTAFSATDDIDTTYKEVGGGTCYHLVLDSKYQMNISLGWSRSDGASGSVFRAGVVESPKASDGYDAVSLSGNSIMSKDIFQSPPSNGLPMAQFRIKISVAVPKIVTNTLEFVLQEEFL